MEISNDVGTTFSQNFLGSSTHSQEYRKLVDWCWKIMRSQFEHWRALGRILQQYPTQSQKDNVKNHCSEYFPPRWFFSIIHIDQVWSILPALESLPLDLSRCRSVPWKVEGEQFKCRQMIKLDLYNTWLSTLLSKFYAANENFCLFWPSFFQEDIHQ